MSKAPRPPNKRPVEPPPEPGKGDKLQKALAKIGLGSRREIERWIEQGRLTIGGRKAKLGDRVISGERVTLDGKPVELDETDRVRCLLYHKPV